MTNIFVKIVEESHCNEQYSTWQSQNQGLSQFLFLWIVLKLLQQRKIDLNDRIAITEVALKEKGKGVVGYDAHDELSLLQVLQNYKITAGIDSLYLLANHIHVKTKKRVSDYFSDEIRTLGLSEACAGNLSGKTTRKFSQTFYLDDIFKIAESIAGINPFYLEILSSSKIGFKAKNYMAETFLLDRNKVDYFFRFFNIAVFWRKISKAQTQVLVIPEVINVFQQDSWVERIIEQRDFRLKEGIDHVLDQECAYINLIGDSYLGEYYSERRRKRQVFDPLLHEGYDYSFEKLKDFLADSDFNLTNHEACFIPKDLKSPLTGLKKFILGAIDQPSITALKKANIHCVGLANNHTADFGSEGIEHTVRCLKEYDLDFFGAGLNEYDACQPYRLQVGQRVISIFAGYWYRATNHKIFDFYATPSKAGVATLESMLVEAIELEKKQYPQHTIVVFAHWGVDFLPVQSYQRMLAKRLFEQGTDLIIGHGAHTLQTMEYIDGKPALYSIGNGIFNSDGEFDGYPDALPFGMIAQLQVSADDLQLKLMPIKANNRETKWQPNFVDFEEFSNVNAFYHAAQFDEVQDQEWPYYFVKKI